MDVAVDSSWSGSDSNVPTIGTLETENNPNQPIHNVPVRPPSPHTVHHGERTPLLHPDLPVEHRPKGFRIRGIKGLRWNYVRWRKRRFWATFWSLFWTIGLVTIIVLLGTLRKKKPTMGNGNAVCLTDACVHAASEVLWSLAPNYKEIDPCTDFEALTCNGWKQRHMLGAADTRISMFSELNDDAFRIVRTILEDGYPGSSNHSDYSPRRLMARSSDVDKENYNMLVDMYGACMNTTAIEDAGSQPLSVVLDDIIKMFPEDDESADKSWVAEANLYFSQLGWNTIAAVGPGPDDMNPETIVINVYPPSSISLPANEYYTDPEITDAYTVAIAESLFPLLPGNLTTLEATPRAANVVAFESRLAGAIPPESLLYEVEDYYNLMPYEDTMKLAPVIGLDKTVEALAPAGYDYKSKQVIASFPEYLKNVSEIIQDTSDQTLKDFFLWQAVTAFAGKVHAPELRPFLDFKHELYGIDAGVSPERWEICTNHVKDGLEWIVGRFYVEQAFPQSAQEFGQQIVEEVKEQYVARFTEATWMDDETRELAKKKLAKTLVQIGFPKTSPNTTNAEELRKYYKDLKIGPSFFNNTLELNRFSSRRSWDKLAKPADRQEWSMSPAEVNAYNNPVKNKVVFPAAIMQFPVFDAELPSYASYGAFGSVAGHEISHSFDDSGRKFDEDGAYRSWWTNKTIDEFEKRAQCFVEQYSSFSVPDPDGEGEDVPLDGEHTLGEVLADTGGIKVSYDAWNARRQAYPDESLPGLDHFTHEQLFFVFFGMWYCGEQRPKSMVNQALTDPHPPGMFRIKGTLENSRAFKEAFNCPVKEPKCELW